MTDDRRIPLVPLVLGLGGLIPFALLSLAAALDLRTMTLPNLPELARHALALYGATIIAFLGGIRWGQAVQDPDQDRARIHYAISVLPQLAAWGLVVAFQLFGLGRAICFGGLAAIVALSGVADYAFATVGGAPLWFGRLRIILSAGATLALALAAV
jgi:prepilin signal peptidase PulO-like enzyme (type II secretory pathway)